MPENHKMPITLTHSISIEFKKISAIFTLQLLKFERQKCAYLLNFSPNRRDKACLLIFKKKIGEETQTVKSSTHEDTSVRPGGIWD